MSRVKELEKLIAQADRAYWESNDPIMSDEEYDLLVKELRDLAPDHPLVNRLAPVGLYGEEVRLPEQMLSLDKAYTSEEVTAFIRRTARSGEEKYLLMPKYDGVSGLYYRGRLYTRGDGTHGFDITAKLRLIRGLPDAHSARGEIVVLKSTFAQYRDKVLKENGTPYKTPRAMAAGLVNAKDTPDIDPVLTFMPFEAEAERFEAREELDWPAVLEACKGLDAPTDGVVVRLADEEYSRSLGATAHHIHGAIAVKYANPTGVTRLESVVWQVGKRKITPVAIVEPVEIDGYTNTRASLHNWSQIQTLRLGLGDKVLVERCGQIIPQVTKVLESAGNPIEPPAACPVCSAPTEYWDPHLVCTNTNCPGTQAQRLMEGLTRLGFDDVGPAVAQALVEAGYTSPSRVLRMTAAEWEALPRFGRASAQRMVVQSRRLQQAGVEDWRILAALTIPSIGPTIAKNILDKVSLVELRDGAEVDVEGVGPARRAILAAGLEEQAEELTALVALLPIISTTGESLKPTVCFTGKSERSRDEWVRIAVEHGYRFQNSVTKKLSLLVCADLNSQSTKAQKARKYGIQMVTYEQFAQMIGG